MEAGARREEEDVVNVEFRMMVEIHNDECFHQYFSKAKSFDSIFLKMGFFNGIEPIFP